MTTNRTHLTRRVALLVVAGLVVLALLAEGCSFGGSSKTLPMQLRVITGIAKLIRDGETRSVRSNAKVGVGDVLVVPKDSLVELGLADGILFEFASRPTSKDGRLSISSGTKLSLVRGQILGKIKGTAAVQVSDVLVGATDGDFRVDRDLSTRIGTYEGQIRLKGGLDEIALPSFSQVVLAGGPFPKSWQPLRISSSDRWDKQYLQDALALDAWLGNFARGLEAQLGPTGGLEFFQKLDCFGAPLDFAASYLTYRRSDVLIGLSLAAEASGRTPLGLPSLFQRVFDQGWLTGATWGLLAHQLGISQTSISDRLVCSINKAGLSVQAGQGPGARRKRGKAGTPPTGGTSPPPPSSPPPPPPPSPSPGIIDNLLKGLTSPTP